MTKKSIMKRLGAGILALTMAVGLLTGCKGAKTEQASIQMDKDHVYHGDYLSIPEGIKNIENIAVSDDSIFFGGYNSKSNNEFQIYSVSPDGSNMQCVYDGKGELEGGNVNAYAIDSEGNLVMVVNLYDMNENVNPEDASHYYIVKIGKDGAIQQKEELEIKDGTYPEKVVLDGKGNIMVYSYETILMFSKEFKKVAEIDVSNQYVDSVFVSKDDKFMITQYSSDYSSRTLKEYDENSKSFVESKTMKEGIGTNSIYPAADYDFYLSDRSDLYGYSIATGEKTKLLNWIDSDVDGTYMNMIAGLKDGRIVGCIRNWIKDSSEIVVLTKVDPKDVKDKKVISVAVVYSDNVNSQIIEFNKKSEEYRIVLKDYSVYNTDDDYLVGYRKLNEDLTAGNIPDVLCVSELTPMESYCNKGLFVDINTLIEKDESFHKEDYLSNIFEAFQIDGKQYSVAPAFYPFTFVGKESILGDKMGWTMEEMRELMAKQPEGTELISQTSKETMLSYGLYLSMDEYIDWREGKCSFNQDGFKKLLEFANEFKSQEELEKESSSMNGNGMYDYEAEQMKLKKGEVLLQMPSLNNFKDFHRTQKETFGEEVCFKGFPSEEGNGSAFNPTIQFAISAKSANLDAAWAFVKSTFEDDYQESIDWGWPVKYSALEKRLEEDRKVETYTDENGKEVEYEETFMNNGKEEKLGQVTDEEYEKVLEFLKSVKQVMRMDENVEKIITEETGGYFAGQKTVDETCELIQNRVQTYLNETR